ncbi:uncharacterized protein LOC128889846 isoform X2 [Hylaeus anthracinus]|nr:uncharacterized protein LOC128889846 isoform X2 [Hylaeus anthracinus]
MRGIKRIFVFCILTTILPVILLVTPLYLRHHFYANVAYTVTESDILEITDKISTIFCSEHTLQMNRTFNAFQMSQNPERTPYKKHIRLKKSMTLPDDTLEYWGFYLLEGSSVALSVCSRFQGASILLVKGEHNLRTCGMLEHNNNEQIVENVFLPEAERQVKVMFKTDFEEAISNNSIVQVNKNVLHNVEDKLLENVTVGDTDIDIMYADTHIKNKEIHKEEQNNYVAQQNKGSLEEKIIYTARKLRHPKQKQYRKFMKENRKNLLQSLKKEQDWDIQERKFNLKIADEDNIKQKLKMNDKVLNKKIKRSLELVEAPLLLDQGIKHGGNAIQNITNANDDSSISSFENELLRCYGGSILVAQEFAPSEQCINITYLLNGKHMQTIQNIEQSGYYYYIFYSDNDIVSNDVHAIFDIYKPILQFENVTKSCTNQTKCSFPVDLLSSHKVIVEVPTMDGIEYRIDDVGLLLSICHPRMEVYIFFPIAVLFCILTCAFM